MELQNFSFGPRRFTDSTLCSVLRVRSSNIYERAHSYKPALRSELLLQIINPHHLTNQNCERSKQQRITSPYLAWQAESFYGCTSGLRYTRCSFNKENLPQSATLASVFAATAWQPVFISRLNSGLLPNYCYFLYSHANIFPEWWISFWSRMFWRANVFVTDPIMKKKKS